MGYATIQRTGLRLMFQGSARTKGLAQGFAPGGFADWEAAQLANRLVRNPKHHTLLECEFGGLALAFEDHCVIAFTRSDRGAVLEKPDGSTQCLSENTAYRIPANSTLAMPTNRRWLRSYIAVAGGFNAPSFCGSTTTVITEEKLPIKELPKPLSAQSKIHFDPRGATSTVWDQPLLKTRDLDIACGKDPSGKLAALIQPAYQFGRFSAACIQRLSETSFFIEAASTRQAVVLTPDPINRAGFLDTLPSSLDCSSEPLLYGSVQVTANGTLYVMGCDRKPTGGYAKLGWVGARDMNQLMRSMPGTKVQLRFSSITNSAESELAD